MGPIISLVLAVLIVLASVGMHALTANDPNSMDSAASVELMSGFERAETGEPVRPMPPTPAECHQVVAPYEVTPRTVHTPLAAVTWVERSVVERSAVVHRVLPGKQACLPPPSLEELSISRT